MKTTTKMTPGAVEALRQRVYELMAAPNATASELKAAALLFRECGAAGSNGWQRDAEKYEADTVRTGLERRAELPPSDEENPLDDDEKLRQVRIAVFGSAPES